MSPDDVRDLEIRSWILAEGTVEAPDRLREAVRADLARTAQERHILGLFEPLRRRLAQPALAGAAVGVLIVATLAAVLSMQPGTIGGPGPSPSPSNSPSQEPSPLPTPLPSPIPTPVGNRIPAGVLSSTQLRPSLQVSLPDGWTLRLDRTNLLVLIPPGAGWLRQNDGAVYFDGISVFARPHAGQPDGVQEPVPGVGDDAKSLANWLADRPQLTTTEVIETTLGGRPAYQIDAELSPQAGGLCGVPCVNLLDGPTPAPYSIGLVGTQRSRLLFVDAPDGSTVVLTVDDVDGAGFDDEMAAVQPVLDSLSFVP